TYMSVMRDLYGETIYIPSQQDSNAAFRQYVEDVQAGRISAGAEVSLKDGRVSVQGVQGVMMINGILARMIFDHNKKKHAFYVEESYVIPWMYPYLEPHGLIMKINSEPIQITPEMVKNDRDFWDWYTRRLLGNVKFERDVVARKTFSKLRSAIAGIYAYRRMFDEAEYAFLQAIDLYPLSPEANFRLADIYMQERKYAKAIELVERLYNGDPGNDRVKDFLNQIKGTEEKDRRRQEIERQFASGQADLNAAMELAELYQRLGFGEQFQSLTMQMLNQTNLPPDVCLRVGQIFANAKRMDLLEIALKKYLERQPNNPRIWIDLAAVHAVRNQPGNAIEALKRAVALGGDPVRDIARKDNRFDAIRNTPEFQELIPSAPAQQGFQLPFSGL
ncbi:MAG: tetratricopeptide repeat protein, partial [Verrucomicrobia bacterium]|nr:tetratricopeptide repeat protein [Verrucomicrobiota bacterium]